MSISFVVKQTPEPPAPEWVSYFDNTYWSAGPNTSWDGSKWVESGPPGSIRVNELGSWVEGFRPTKVRITGTYSWASFLTVRDTGGGFIGNAASGASVEIDLTFTAFDISYMNLYGMSDITNIEFFGG